MNAGRDVRWEFRTTSSVTRHSPRCIRAELSPVDALCITTFVAGLADLDGGGVPQRSMLAAEFLEN